MKKTITILFFILSSVALCKGAVSNDFTDIDTPLKAAIFYFPSPPVMRCLVHSGIPGTFRKALVYRKVRFPGGEYVEQSVTIGVDSKQKNKKRFVLSGNLLVKGKIIPIKINEGEFFDLKKGKKLKPDNLFGLEELIGLQRKVSVTDTIGNQELNYEVFLKTTKGKIGNQGYSLELFGQDKSINKQIKYFLRGKGNLGKDKISVIGKEIETDHYKLNEQYGKIKTFTTIQIYD